MGEDSKGLGKALQTARQLAGMTQQDLCHKAQISYSTLAKIERGAIKTPSVFTVARIANVLGISMDNLLGAVVDTKPLSKVGKQKSKNGISFLFVDINGCLVRFFHGAFTKLSHETGVSSDVVESTFWHFNDAVCRGEMSLNDFNYELGARFNVGDFDWKQYYMDAIEPIEEMHDLVRWVSGNYRIGLLSNIMPGFIDTMIETGKLPNIKYDVIIDSSVVGAIKPEQQIYEIAQNKAGVSPEEILFVDDSRSNLMAAEHMGWKVLWFDDYRPSESVKKIRESLA